MIRVIGAGLSLLLGLWLLGWASRAGSEDPTVTHVAAEFGARYSGRHFLADAAITLWDLLNTSTASTAGEAAERLRDVIRGGGLGA